MAHIAGTAPELRVAMGGAGSSHLPLVYGSRLTRSNPAVSSGILPRLPWNRSVRADNVAVVMAEDVTRRARVRGALLGLACGDALGAPFEGQPSVRAADLAAWAAVAAPLRVTDDTVLALAVAGHLADRGGQVDQDRRRPAWPGWLSWRSAARR